MKLSSIPTGDWLREDQPQTLLDGYYCPLYVEPMSGSGERICVAVAAATLEGFVVAPSPGIDRLSCFYDEKSDFLLRLIEEVRCNLQDTFARDGHWNRFGDGEPINNFWKSPFTGFKIGETAWATGKDAAEIADIGLMMCSSLTAKVEAAEKERQESINRRTLLARVYGLVTAKQDWGRYFDVSFSGLDRIKFDFVGRHLAAHISVLKLEHKQEKIHAFKAGAVDLVTLKKGGPQIIATSTDERDIQRYCVLLYSHTEKRATKRQKQELAADKINCHLASRNLEVEVKDCNTVQDIAEQLIELEAA